MFRRVCSRLCRIALGMVIVLLLLSLVFIWRLVEKPISLNLLTPYIDMASRLYPTAQGSEAGGDDPAKTSYPVLPVR